jgi:hypothetical protein
MSGRHLRIDPLTRSGAPAVLFAPNRDEYYRPMRSALREGPRRNRERFSAVKDP